MSKWLRGFAAGAALMWAASAQAAYVQFTVQMKGLGEFGEYTNDFTEYHEWRGQTTAQIYFSMEEGETSSASGGIKNIGDAFINGTVYDDSCGPCGGSFSAVLPSGTFPLGAQALDGLLNPISSTASINLGGHYSFQSFSGVVTSITAVRVDQLYAEGVSISPVHRYAVPEPSTWAMMLIGFGVVGASIRRRNPLRQVA